jgi:hypothetical protein
MLNPHKIKEGYTLLMDRQINMKNKVETLYSFLDWNIIWTNWFKIRNTKQQAK